MKRLSIGLLSLGLAAVSAAADIGDHIVIPHGATSVSRPSPKSYNVKGALAISGNVWWSVNSDQTTATVNIDRLTNKSPWHRSGAIQLELTLVILASSPGGPNASPVARFDVTPAGLNPGQSLTNLAITAPLRIPPDGIYTGGFITVLEDEPRHEFCFPGPDYCFDSMFGFDGRVQVNNGIITIFGPLPPLTPETGMWWNPDEPGSGFVLAVREGVLVLSAYSYGRTGEPIWYLVTGATTNSNRNFSGFLTKYRNGQCISCPTHNSPLEDGNDGVVSIVFHSNTSATIYLPGGRASNIVPHTF